MHGHKVFLATFLMLLSIGVVRAQEGVTLESLSAFEQGQAKALIDRLSSATEAQYSDRLTELAQDFARVGLNPKAVLTVIRAAAGDKTEFFDRVLQSKCTADGGTGSFCMVAKADEDTPKTDEVSTAATAAGGAVGGAISGTGSEGGNAVNTGSSGGSDSGRNNLVQSFNFRGGTPSSISETVIGGTTLVTVPGPTAGAGLGALALVFGIAAARRRAAARSLESSDR